MRPYRTYALAVAAATIALLSAFGVRARDAPQDAEAEQVRSALWVLRIDSLLREGAAGYVDYVEVLHEIRYDSALMAELRRRAAEAREPLAESFAVNRLGTLHRRGARYAEALAAHQRARALSERAGDTLGQVMALNSRGIVFRNTDRITEALDAHQAAEQLARAYSVPDRETLRALAIAHDSKGRIHLKLDQLDRAEAEFRASMAIEREIGSTLGLAINSYNLGTINERRGRLDSALYHYRAALALNEEIGSDIGRGINYIGMARVLTRQESYGAALKYARDALPLVEARRDDYYTATAELAYAAALLAVGNDEQAARHLERAEQIAAERQFVAELAEVYRLRSRLAEARGQPAEALALYRTAMDHERRVLNEQNQRYVTALSARYDSELKEAEIARLAQENELVRERARRTRRNFIGLVVLLAFLAAILFILYRQRKLVLQRDLVRLEQQRLASQMNPHFLFNALNSVKSYLISNEGDVAVQYLTKFAKLMRRILTSTIDEEVPLAEELENCRLYVAVENARFDEAIDFEITVDPEVDPEAVTVPPLVLQPFLENALWHGLRQKRGERLLELEVRALEPRARRRPGRDAPPDGEPEGFELVVRDNGIGRDAARATQSERKFRRSSLGLPITRQRLDHFARRHGRTARFRIADLAHADGSPAGTEVILRVD